MSEEADMRTFRELNLKKKSRKKRILPLDQPFDGSFFKERIMPHTNIDELLKQLGKQRDRKIILLGKENLEKLRGYKAYVEKDSITGELIIIITGLDKSCNEIFDSLKPLKPEEIHEEEINPSIRKK